MRAKHWNTALYQEIYEKLGIAYTESQKERIHAECKKLPSLPAFAKFLVSPDMYIQEKYTALCKSLGLENLTDRNLGMHGSNISGGEKNRIALARFLLPEGAEFFILNGLFVNIDILSLKNCLEVFAKYKPCENGIIVSHDLMIIKQLCNIIMAAEQDGTVCTGTEEVLTHSPLYKALHEEYQAFHTENGKCL